MTRGLLGGFFLAIRDAEDNMIVMTRSGKVIIDGHLYTKAAKAAPRHIKPMVRLVKSPCMEYYAGIELENKEGERLGGARLTYRDFKTVRSWLLTKWEGSTTDEM